MNGLVTAFRTLSILPIPGKDAKDFSTALPWFPIVGASLGGLLAILALALSSLPTDVAAGFLLLAGVLLTRGFHIDGLADCADGFGGGYTRERVLEIMKDSATGVFGTLAIVLSLFLKWLALKHLLMVGNLVVIVLAYTLSRALIVEQTVCWPYARKKGTASSFVAGATQLHRIIALLIAAAAAFLAAGPLGFTYLAIAWLAAYGIGLYSKRRIKGITGDVLGATSECVETLVLLLPLFI
ncbi:MAG: adenosylcobinamide-GDP ribazoletransferase [Verrucomicrobiota bacterium]